MFWRKPLPPVSGQDVTESVLRYDRWIRRALPLLGIVLISGSFNASQRKLAQDLIDEATR